jgi:hypothetical protein
MLLTLPRFFMSVFFIFLIAWATYEILIYSEKRRRDNIIAREEKERTEYYQELFNKGREL